MATSWGDKRAMLIMPTDVDPPMDVVSDWVASTLAGVSRFGRLRAALVAVELVSNARRHGPGPYVLHLSLHGALRVLLIAVEDEEPELGADRPGSAQLALLAAMSKQWGVVLDDVGKIVWAQLSLLDSGSDTSDRVPPTVHGEP